MAPKPQSAVDKAREVAEALECEEAEVARETKAHQWRWEELCYLREEAE
jgi:hypothetical protein